MGRYWGAECSVKSVIFPQHGLVDTPDMVGDSSAQPCRLQSLLPARDIASCGEKQVVAGLTQRKKRYHALTTSEVLRWLKLVPTHLELQIRRPRWWQSILMDREGNEGLLGIFFGKLGAEVEGPFLDQGTLSSNVHPWALQLKVDLQSLNDIEPGREFTHAWQGNMSKLVMDGECRTRNVLFDSLHTCETVWRGRPIAPSNVPSLQRAAPDVNFVRPRGGLISHMVRAHGFYDPVQ